VELIVQSDDIEENLQALLGVVLSVTEGGILFLSLLLLVSIAMKFIMAEITLEVEKTCVNQFFLF
jgi:hypothetical protein